MKIKPIPSEGMIQMADQSLVSYLYIFSIKVVYRENKVRLRTSVIKTLEEPMILGMDFLSALEFEVRINGDTLTRSCGTDECEHIYSLTSREFFSDEEGRKLAEVLEHYNRKFSKVRGLSTVASHQNRKPLMKIIDEEIDKLLLEDQIELSQRPYSSPIVLAR